MIRLIGRLAMVAAVPALLMSEVPATATPAPAAATGTPVVVPVSPAQQLMTALIMQTNQIRATAGCGPVAVDEQLVAASLQQSAYMAATGTFGHLGRGGSTFVARARAAGYASPAGENIAWGYTTAAEVMDAWMASPPHRANILNCSARSIGTGVQFTDAGTPFYTQVFGRA
jgi:uncharacterized protein YkwD